MADHLLTQFFKALRGADVRVSTSEAIDAMQTVELLGYRDRERLKAALSLVLAKSEPEKFEFDLCFDQFFKFAAFEALLNPIGCRFWGRVAAVAVGRNSENLPLKSSIKFCIKLPLSVSPISS